MPSVCLRIYISRRWQTRLAPGDRYYGGSLEGARHSRAGSTILHWGGLCIIAKPRRITDAVAGFRAIHAGDRAIARLSRPGIEHARSWAQCVQRMPQGWCFWKQSPRPNLLVICESGAHAAQSDRQRLASSVREGCRSVRQAPKVRSTLLQAVRVRRSIAWVATSLAVYLFPPQLSLSPPPSPKHHHPPPNTHPTRLFPCFLAA